MLLIAAIAFAIILRRGQHVVGRAIGVDVDFFPCVTADVPFEHPGRLFCLPLVHTLLAAILLREYVGIEISLYHQLL